MEMNEPGRIRAVSFDGDMTLWDFEKVMRRSLALVLAELRRRVPGQRTADLTVDGMIEIRDCVASELKDKVVNLEKVRLQAFVRTVEAVGRPDATLAAELSALYLKHRYADIELYADVIPCLDALAAECPLGLLTNGNGHPDRCGLPGRFRFVVFAQDVGVAKPDARVFLAACQQAGCAPCQLMHVGDSLETDVAGANGVGAVSVWLNREGHRNDSGTEPDYQIQSLSELPDLVRHGGMNAGRPDSRSA
jgi:putative hydrolase of the HAD superfamily